MKYSNGTLCLIILNCRKFNSTGNVKKQGITKVIYNCDIKRRAVCEFVKDNLQTSKSNNMARLTVKYTEMNKYNL